MTTFPRARSASRYCARSRGRLLPDRWHAGRRVHREQRRDHLLAGQPEPAQRPGNAGERVVPTADADLLLERRLVVHLPQLRQDRREVRTRRERQIRGDFVVEVRRPGVRVDAAGADAVAALVLDLDSRDERRGGRVEDTVRAEDPMPAAVRPGQHGPRLGQRSQCREELVLCASGQVGAKVVVEQHLPARLKRDAVIRVGMRAPPGAHHVRVARRVLVAVLVRMAARTVVCAERDLAARPQREDVRAERELVQGVLEHRRGCDGHRTRFTMGAVRKDGLRQAASPCSGRDAGSRL